MIWLKAKKTLIPIFLTIAMMGFIFGIAWLASYQEVKSYRKFCDTEVTAWDALWLDLRVDECN